MNLEELARLEQGATYGYWSETIEDRFSIIKSPIRSLYPVATVDELHPDSLNGGNAKFIVAIRNDARELIEAAVERDSLKVVLRRVVFGLGMCPECKIVWLQRRGQPKEYPHRDDCELAEAIK